MEFEKSIFRIHEKLLLGPKAERMVNFLFSMCFFSSKCSIISLLPFLKPNFLSSLDTISSLL